MPWKESDIMDQKLKFVLAALREDVVFTELCREFGITPVTGRLWRERFLAEGMEGLHERSRRPQRSPSQLGEDIVCRMIKLKTRYPRFGPEIVRVLYAKAHGTAPSLSSFKRVLGKAGLVQPRKLRRRSDPAIAPKTVLRPTAPNEIWTADFKGWWPTADGRCEPLTLRDSYSRYILGAQAMATTRTAAVRPLFERWFEQYGLPKIIHTDNGAPFASTRAPLGLSQLSAWWIALGIQVSRSRPGHPQDNGGHERMHRDLEDGVQPLITQAGREAQTLLDQWREEFNCVRPHRSLQMRCPHEIYQPSSRPYQGTPDAIDYGPGFESRRVGSNGVIAIHRSLFFITHALAGWNVGLKPRTQTRLQLWFDCLYLGELDLELARFIWASPDEAPVS
jgi:transposase InsO family protein